MDPKGFTRCDGFVGHVPQNFINNNLPTCPLCGSPDPYWTLKDKIEFTAHRVMFRCQHCGGVLSATQNDFDGTTKSTAYAILNSGGAMNALIKKRQGKDVKTVYMKVVDVGACRTTNELLNVELPLEDFQRMAASFSAQPQTAPVTPAEPLNMDQVQVSYGQPAQAQPQAVPVQPTPVQPQPIPQPLNMDQVQVHYAQPQYVPPQPVYAQPQYVQPQYVQPQYVQPQYVPPQPQYVQPQTAVQQPYAATPNTIQQSPRMPIASIIMMCLVLTIQMIYVLDFASVYTLSYFSAYGLILTGMLMYKKNLQFLIGIGFLLLATAELSEIVIYNGVPTDILPMIALLTLGIAFFIPKASVSLGLRIAGVSISFIADIIWLVSIIEWYPVELLMFFLITQSCLSAAVLLLKPNKR